MADHDETMSKLSPGTRTLLQLAEGLRVKYDHEAVTCRHLLQLLLERHGPMAEDLCPGLKAGPKLREVTDQLTRGEAGTPVESALIAAEAVKKAEARGKSVAYERDLAAVILEANGLVVVTQTATTSQTATSKQRRSRKPSAKKDKWLPDFPLDPAAALWQFGRDLTLEACDGKLPPLVGREEEIDLLIETLCRRTKRNPALVGPAGVGKTAIVEGLAQRIVAGDVPDPLRHRRIVALQASLLIAGAGTYGEIEKRMKAILAEAKQEGVLLFIDEVHSLMGAGGREGATDLASQLKPVLARGEIACIAATTDDEYRRFIERDEALERRFQPVRIQEPSAEETLQVLLRLRTDLTAAHKIEVPDEVLHWLVTFAETHMRNRHFPDKGVDLLEQVVAHALAHQKPQVTHEIAWPAPLLKDLFGEMVHVDADDPVFMLPLGSTVAQITVVPWGKDDATVCTRAIVTVGSEISLDLCSHLLHRNSELRFGAFGLDKDDWVFFEHTIVGSALDKEELKASVLAVVSTADQSDEEITKRWGGQRMEDWMQSH